MKTTTIACPIRLTKKRVIYHLPVEFGSLELTSGLTK
jgi:hypothetical protein